MSTRAMNTVPATATDIHRRRWMLFVDGENLATEGQKVATSRGVTLDAGPFYRPDVFLWFKRIRPSNILDRGGSTVPVPLQLHVDRAFYYTQAVGDDETLDKIRDELRALGFHPEVFKRQKGRDKAKGMDISVARDILSHGFRNNYDAVVLVAGDGDYLPLVEEVMRLGKVVYLAFFPGAGLNQTLRRTCDHFIDLSPWFDQWSIA